MSFSITSLTSFVQTNGLSSYWPWSSLVIGPLLAIVITGFGALRDVPRYQLTVDDSPVHSGPAPAHRAPLVLFPHSVLRLLLTPAHQTPHAMAVSAYVVKDGWARRWPITPARSIEGSFLWQGPADQLPAFAPGPLELIIYVGPGLLLPRRSELPIDELPGDHFALQRFSWQLVLQRSS